ncbi:MAG: sulfatase, partial [Bryobacteraceae bacterium]
IGITTPSCHLPEVILEQKVAAKAPATQKALQCNSITRLKQEYSTLAESLKAAGYATAHFGKWHLGAEPYDALHQGFDVDMPHTFQPAPVGGYLGPWSFWKDKGQPGEHIEDRMAREASQFIADHKDRPFYLNYWAFSVHSPWQAKKDYIEKYRGRTDPKNANRSAVYGAMVQSLDEGVGRILQAIDDAGIASNTIIVFFSDNGGVFWEPGPGVMHPGYEKIPPTSNAPLRAGKATLYEGGTREPCIVVWPGKAKAGSRSDEVVSSVDFHPTLLEMTGVTAAGAGKFDGISFVPALSGKAIKREAIFCHFPHYAPRTGGRPGSYVRKGDWKLIRFWSDNDDQSDRFELYNLKKDVRESSNMAGQMPGKVKELNILLEGFLRDTKAVIPKPNPDYRKT